LRSAANACLWQTDGQTDGFAIARTNIALLGNACYKAMFVKNSSLECSVFGEHFETADKSNNVEKLN